MHSFRKRRKQINQAKNEDASDLKAPLASSFLLA
jgi:hypothetical protein